MVVPDLGTQMQPTYNHEAETYRQKIQAFLAEHLPANWSGLGALDQPERQRFVEEWRALLAENRLLAVSWPEEYGGAGLSEIERIILAEEFAKAGVPEMKTTVFLSRWWVTRLFSVEAKNKNVSFSRGSLAAKIDGVRGTANRTVDQT